MTNSLETLLQDLRQEIHGVQFLSRHLGDMTAAAVEPLAARLCEAIGSGVVALTAIAAGKAYLVIAVTPDLTERVDLSPLLQTGVEVLGGRIADNRHELADGVATGNGPKTGNTADALTAVGEALAALLDATMRGEAEAIA